MELKGPLGSFKSIPGIFFFFFNDDYAVFLLKLKIGGVF